MKLNEETLNKAIEEFNDWTGAARIYLDKNDGCFETAVYPNDVTMTETFSCDNFVAVYSKQETENKNIGNKRKNYIVNYSDLIIKGWDILQAKYKLFEEGLIEN